MFQLIKSNNLFNRSFIHYSAIVLLFVHCLPVHGGPWSNTPLHGLSLPTKSFYYFSDKITAS